MTLRYEIETAAAILVIVLGILGFRTWLSEHDARVHAEETVKAQQATFDSAVAEIKSLRETEAQRDAARDQQVAAIAAVASKAMTPAEIAAWLPKQGSALPQPITVTIPAATPANPAPNATASIPEADLAPLRDQIAKCQECAIKLATAQQDLTSKDSQLAAAGQELSAAERERDAYKVELKGGTVWTRTKRALKWIAIGGLVAGGAICGTGHCK